MFAGINMFWVLLRLILARAARRNTIITIITLEDIEEINTEKMRTKQSEEYFFHQRCEKTSTNFEMAYDYLILTFYWFILTGQNGEFGKNAF